jgi:hypothetical protein
MPEEPVFIPGMWRNKRSKVVRKYELAPDGRARSVSRNSLGRHITAYVDMPKLLEFYERVEDA